jgi:3-deoxy-D-manno-octulosonic-acid transferase
MLHADAARVVADGTELTAFVRRCLEDPEWAKQLGERARRLVVSQQGATERTLALLEPLLARRFHGNTRLSPRPARVADPAA